MRSDKFRAYKLRMAGRSYNEMNKALRIPKSTLSGWFCNLEIPEEARKRLKERVRLASLRGLMSRNKNQTRLALERSKKIREKAERSINKLTKRDLLILGTSLYWAEGYKRPVVISGKQKTWHSVSLINSDPDLISVFIRFLIEVCGVSDEKINIWVRYFKHQDPAYVLDFWQKRCKLPYGNFRKTLQTMSVSSQRKKSYNSLPYGVAQVSVNNTNLYHKIMGFISGISRNR